MWGRPPESSHVRILPLRPCADDAELRQRTAYPQALVSCSEWSGTALGQCDDPRQFYENAAAAILQSIEADIAQRAVTAGLVIGLNRNSLIDTLSIAASAFELQLHVLTRLGKRPSPRAWFELLKRTSASLFLNSYVSREDALCLNLAIRKAALGLERSIGTKCSAKCRCRGSRPRPRSRP
ncbi:MAG: hypothetical protein HYR60_20750 [Acidobacteria bacterium]|nr:hypothetical protein [Acidobacteriota bacterium]